MPGSSRSSSWTAPVRIHDWQRPWRGRSCAERAHFVAEADLSRDAQRLPDVDWARDPAQSKRPHMRFAGDSEYHSAARNSVGSQISLHFAALPLCSIVSPPRPEALFVCPRGQSQLCAVRAELPIVVSGTSANGAVRAHNIAEAREGADTDAAPHHHKVQDR